MHNGGFSEKLNDGQSGFSLIELMITAAIFLVVMAATFGILRMGVLMRSSVNDRTETIDNARMAINSIGREAVNAGLGYARNGSIVPDDFTFSLLNTPNDPGTARDLFTSIVAGNGINSSVLSSNGQKNDVITFIFRDLNFNGGNPVIVKNTAVNANYMVLKTPPGGCVDCRQYDLYSVESADGNQALALATAVLFNSDVHIENNDPMGLNRAVAGTASTRSILTECAPNETANCFNYTPQATLKRVFLTSYSVDNSGALIRTTYGNNTGGNATQQIQRQPMAYGVQNFQVRYLMQDGTVSDDPSNGGVDQAKMNDVVQIEIRITIQTTRNVAGATTVDTVNLSAYSSTRNLKYDVE